MPPPISGLSELVRSVLRCPQCGHSLVEGVDIVECAQCGTKYGLTNSALDLRLQRPREHPTTFLIGEPPLSNETVPVVPLVARAGPAVDFDGVEVPEHLTPVMLSHFPAAPHPHALALDLGCGWGVHRPVVERAGFEWVGLDYSEIGAPIFGDAHALPFADAVFDFVLTIAVLEHLRYPFVGMEEAYRVMKPGCTLIGTVSFLEPCHGDSHYHHTHLGTVNTLLHAGFDVDAVAPHTDWMVLRAQSEMGMFPTLSSRSRRWLVGAIERVHRRSWRRADGEEGARLRNTTGAFTFIARKPA